MGDSFDKYKRAYLNSRINPNPSFCTLPWYHLATNAFGRIILCCRSHLPLKEGSQELNFTTNSLDAVWNGTRYQEIRSAMQEGTLLPECEVCTAEERAQRVLSKRLKENYKYYERFDHLKLAPSPRYLSLNFGSLCNLRCRMCFPSLSSQIYTELKNLLPTEEGRSSVPREVQTSFEVARNGGSPTWVEESGFLDQIDYKNLVEVYLTGGEPSLQPSFFEFLRRCLTAGRSDLFLRIQSNLTQVPKAFVELLNQFQRVQLICSVDGVGELANYVRYPSQFAAIDANFDQYCRQLSDNIEIVVQCSVNTYSILQLADIVRWYLTKTKIHSARTIHLWINPVHHPYCLCITCLPEELKTLAIERLSVVEKEVEIQNVKHQIADIAKFIKGRPFDPKLFGDFLRYASLLDRSRSQDLGAVIPEFAPFL